MTFDELTPYLGLLCSLHLHCRACDGGHVLCGVPRLGRYAGDFLLGGYLFCIEDIEQIWRHDDLPRRRLLSRYLLSRRFPFPSEIR